MQGMTLQVLLKCNATQQALVSINGMIANPCNILDLHMHGQVTFPLIKFYLLIFDNYAN